MRLESIHVPDIGDLKNVDVIEVHLKPGQTLKKGEPMITLENDKASLDLPAPLSGQVQEVLVKIGSKVSEGDLLLRLAVDPAEVQSLPPAASSSSTASASAASKAQGATPPTSSAPSKPSQSPASPASPSASSVPAAASASTGPLPGAHTYDGKADKAAQVVVLGSGPGGYTAAFRSADLGLQTILVERDPTLGGVCLNVGCIPSKALLHAAKVIEETRDFSKHGLVFSEPTIDLAALRSWKEGIVRRLTGGLTGLADRRKVEVVRGYGRFLDPYHLEATDNEGKKTVIRFEKCIIAAGSEAVKLPFLPKDDRIIDSTGALELRSIPRRMLVIGGGIIGLEMATVYHALGSEITVVEMLDGLMFGADRDIVRPFQKRIQARYKGILLETRVTKVEATDKGLLVAFEGKQAPAEPQTYDMILVAVGRVPNGKKLDADKAGIAVTERGFIPAVDKQMRTNVPHIFAIGDIIGQPMLAHKATHEGKVAAEVCAGQASFFDAKVIPSVAYTDPEVAWVGLTEIEAKAQGKKIGKGVFPWAASGRSLALGREEGMTKLLFDEETDKLLGAGIVGTNAGDLISEIALAIEMGADARDIGLTVHPHPTLSETVAFASEAFEGSITDLYLPKRGRSHSSRARWLAGPW